jgi:hypothetical protein
VSEKAEGERCATNAECGRKGLCIFETVLSAYGHCMNMLSASDGTIVYPLYLTDMADTSASTYIRQSDFEKVCRSVNANSTTGRCATGLQSKNKVVWESNFLGISLHL